MNAPAPSPASGPGEGELRTRWPRARCHECGEDTVHAVCCRCARLLCRHHDQVATPVDPRRLRGWWQWRRARDPDEGPAESAAPAAGARRWLRRRDPPPGSTPTTEAADRETGRPDRLNERHYCAECAPLNRVRDLETVAACAVIVLGLAVCPVSALIGVGLVVVGVAHLGLRIHLGRHRRRANRTSTPELDPRVRSLRMTEHLTGSARLDARNRYHSAVEDVHGRIRVEASWGRVHAAALARYRRRRSFPEDHAVTCDSGLLVARGPGAPRFRPHESAGVARGCAFALRPHSADHEVLLPPFGRGDPRWTPEIDYDITPPESGWRMPLWVVPAIYPGSERHVLELQLHWRTCGPEPEDEGIPLARFDFVRLTVPGEWREVESQGLEGAEAEDVVVGHRTITFRRVTVQPPLRTARGGCRIWIRFAGQITAVDSQITGRMEARFDGTLSGASGISLYSAGGARRNDFRTRRAATVAALDFTVDLAAVRYEEIRSVPDRARLADDDKLEKKHFEVVPDHRAVGQLTDNLSREGFYIKRVVENPPRPGTAADTVDRFWDIGGRHYEGVHPVDFHIVLTGEERHGTGGTTGSTTVQLSVNGSYAGDEMEERVLRTWRDLWTRVDASLTGAARRPDGSWRAADEPIDQASAQLADLRGAAITLRADILEAAREGHLDIDVGQEWAARIDQQFDLFEPGES